MTSNSSLDNFCGSSFWDSNLTWYTDNPDFTPCFQKTVLVWAPCVYLWVAALIDIYHIVSSKEGNIPWNKLNTSKLVITCLLVILQIINLIRITYESSREGNAIYDADFYDPVVKLLTLMLSVTLLCYNKKYGIKTSGVLFLFWLFLILAGLPQLRSEFVHYSSTTEAYARYRFGSYILYYMLTVIMFVLNCFADMPPKDTPYAYEETQSPENRAGFPSLLTFSWFDPLALTGFRRSLTEDDLWPLKPQMSSKETVPRFEKFWQRALRKREDSSKENASTGDTSPASQKHTKKPTSILPVVCLAFGGPFMFAVLLKVVHDLLIFVSPQLLSCLIGFIESGDQPVWKGYLYAVGLFVCYNIQSLLLGQYFIKLAVVSIQIKNSLCSVVYKKALSLSNAARKESTVGEIINLMSTDVDRNEFTFLGLTIDTNINWKTHVLII